MAADNVQIPDNVVALEVISRDGVPQSLRALSGAGSSPGQWPLTGNSRFSLPGGVRFSTTGGAGPGASLLSQSPCFEQAKSTPSKDTIDARERAGLAAAKMSEELLRGGSRAALATQKRIGWAFAGYLWMLGAMFAVGIGAFVAAVIRGFTAHDASEVVVTAIFGGLSATTFVAVFLAGPTSAMGRAGPHSAWLLAIVNTYWSKLAYFTNAATVIADLNEAQKVLNRDLISYLKYTKDPGDESKTPPANGGGADG